MPVGRFTVGIGAIIYDSHNASYLLLQRAAHRDVGPGDWEGVAGRVDQGESLEAALHREVQEEIGIDVQIEFIVGTTHFYRGEATPENEILSVIYCCTTHTPEDVRLSEEHDQMRWLRAGDVCALLPPEHWLGRAIERAEWLRLQLPRDLRRMFRIEGFDLGTPV